jgi:hypothetical protein
VSDEKEDKAINGIDLAPQTFKLIRTDASHHRLMTFRPIPSTEKSGPKFRNHEAFSALFRAAATLHHLGEVPVRFSVGHYNGRDLQLNEKDALTIIQTVRPEVVLVTMKKTHVGKGNRPSFMFANE